MDTDIIVALIGLAAGVIGVFVGGWLQKRKYDADADQSTAEANNTITDTVMKLIEPLNKRIGELEKKVKLLESRSQRYLKRIIYLMDGIRVLLGQLEAAKIEPCWQPDGWEPDKDTE